MPISDRLRARMDLHQPTVEMTVPVSWDVFAELKAAAAEDGFGNYEALVRCYIDEGLRRRSAALVDGTKGPTFAAEAAMFHQVLPSYLPEYEGRYLAIVGDLVFGPHDGPGDAWRAAFPHQPDGQIFVRMITPPLER